MNQILTPVASNQSLLCINFILSVELEADTQNGSSLFLPSVQSGTLLMLITGK